MDDVFRMGKLDKPAYERQHKNSDFFAHDRSHSLSCKPLLFGLFEKKFEGDDALMHLAARRFSDAGLGMECAAETPAQLQHLLSFRPGIHWPAVAHLSRSLDVMQEEGRNHLHRFAVQFQHLVRGFIIHDQAAALHRFDEYCAVWNSLNRVLTSIPDSPFIFIEYAAGLDPALYQKLIETIQDLERVSCCIDIGHVGLRQVYEAFGKQHPGQNVFACKLTDPDLPQMIDDVQAAVRTALPAVLDLLDGLGHIQKPIHFHLHDGHPLSPFSFFGVSDHLSFLDTIPVQFTYQEETFLCPMFGPTGLAAIIERGLYLWKPELLSFTLEIHPRQGSAPLGEHAGLFAHWLDKTNAERMNFWLDRLVQNSQLVQDILQRSLNHFHHGEMARR